ncbi:STAS domain-containing protein [Methylococcus capsulatus]|jgi:anti-anti-sigma factor|uniref:Anti-sigma factor antagonist BtrV n=1 Tax=Methylococcus capsulatus TaxID=414 RepID=A0AA35USI5_METCP|nr:STAS domain-containing protein [Methylococcus capsulatus]QXP87676.1 STAS domain-containing protein [Methylococcus capsulatus]QXP92584.1 STAS domain-containing protein [Methylococcus capsulatus]UQN12692.1 STAS domain-containing protein [Methylococcus capsulatus]CAI8876401.1 putative anti-sigma factor antagonist BtrV [Methylococcus capsulatus]
MLDITCETRGEVLVAHLSGRIDAAASRAFEEQALAWVDAGTRNLVMDLSSINYISSAGLRVFLLIAKKLKEAEGSVKLCALTPAVNDVFEISGFSRLFSIYPTLDHVI